MNMTIPTISLKKIDNKKEKLAIEIFDACMNVGFFSVKDHEVDISLIESVLHLSKNFFQKPLQKKMNYYIDGGAGQRGYTPFGVETAKNAHHPDQKEFWHHGRSNWDKEYENTMPENLVVHELTGFNESLNELYNQLEKLGYKILSLISLGLELEEDWFKDKINQGNSILRLIHYPKIEKNNMGIRAEEHEDINLVTLLFGTKQKGLEILNNDAKWIPLAVSPETIVCNVGDMLERLTNDKLKSTTHRVINPRGDEAQHSRYSMPFFIHLNPDHIISTIPSCINRENKNKYEESITADNFLHERLKEINLK
tara:strand:+ start:3347 stop:4279 length:933 start_codon:yes stop_codon:yes gene_type:complete